MFSPVNSASTSQAAPEQFSSGSGDDAMWLRIARDAYNASTSYIDNNFRKDWDDGVRAFNGQHASDSKYNHPSFDKRSKLYRPKTRSIIRKNEAAAAAAFFSSMDVVGITATDQSNKAAVISADINKALLQYRLTKSIPWYMVVIGGLQEAQTLGVVCAHVHWEYAEAKEEISVDVDIAIPVAPIADEEYPTQDKVPDNAFAASAPPAVAVIEPPKVAKPRKVLIDRPVVDLVPIENIRIDPAANWTDPVGTSPYIIHLIPMYSMDIKTKMSTGTWRRYSDAVISASGSTQYDTTRASRQGGKEDPYAAMGREVSGYQICWVQRHIHRRDDEDWEFYTLGDFALLTSPRPLKQTVLHGGRPYVIGCCILEAHHPYPSSVAKLGKDLQAEANEVANQRMDNVKFVLNKKFFVKRGREADIAGLVRNVPGGIVMLDDPQNDVKEMSWQDVTASAYQEQQNLDGDMNELLGNFSAAQVMADHGVNGPARNMAMLGQSAGTLVEYLLRTYVETFVQPILRQLIKLEQSYETDEVVLAVAGADAKVFQRYGIDKVTDDLLEHDVTLTVNVGMGATDPQMKLRKFTTAMQEYTAMLKNAPPGIDMKEVGREIFGYMGYQDGSRFLTQGNAQVLQLQQELQKAQQTIQQLESKVKDKSESNMVRLQATKMTNDTKLALGHAKEDAENLRNATTHMRALAEADKSRTHEVNMANLEHAHQRGLASANLAKGAA